MDAPTVDKLLENKDVMKALDDAWKGSFTGTGVSRLYQERGGWIYADPSNVQKLKIREAGKDRSKPVKASSTENPSINLENPESQPGNVAPNSYKVVANFHTHPLPGVSQQPSSSDIINAFARGVPGIVKSEKAIYYYGPARHENMTPASPKGHPTNLPDNPNDKFRGYKEWKPKAN
ncbi:hypothetical protein O6H91_Y301900 [Diphasiastrum complanatum]|nr:hypothetical protein O6H91_Y301900 [Diphasiastrum complanatum]